MCFNFGPVFKQYIKLLYSSPECSVTNNGFHSEFFSISRGIRQGCPISALLFILCVETLAIYIREQKNIQGIRLANMEIKITQFADDTCLYLNGTNSRENVLKVFEDFYRYAGLKLNIDKTEAIWLGKNHRIGKICNVKIINSPTKVLGIWIAKNTDEITRINLDERIDKLNILLSMWSQRNLSIKGKITILKTKALPLITYVCNFIFVCRDFITAIDKILYKFVWKNKHHVKKTTLIANPINGGLKMPNIEAVIKANKLNFIKRILTVESNCNKTASYILKTDDIGNVLKFKNNINFLHPLPKFYEQLLDMWYGIHNNQPTQLKYILQEYIWFNEYILIGNKPTYNKTWYQAGINTIHDLCEVNSILSKELLEQKYHISCDFLYYNGLKAAIPNKWVDEIHKASISEITNFETLPPLSFMCKNKVMTIKEATCKQIYWSEIDKILERPTCYFKWEADYYYASFDWELINMIPYECTAEI